MTVRRQYAGRFFCCGCAAGLGGIAASLQVKGYCRFQRQVRGYGLLVMGQGGCSLRRWAGVIECPPLFA